MGNQQHQQRQERSSSSAIFHLTCKMISRGNGRSSVAASAYRAGETLRDLRTGITHNYSKKEGVIYSQIMLPEDAPEEWMERELLWNEVEKSEKRINSQTAREIEVALPNVLTHEEQIEVLKDYINKNFVSKGMIADFALHDKGDGNPHAHIMLTTREVDKTGFTVKNRDWNSKDLLNAWRENWAKVCNEKLEEKGLDLRIDHRSYEEQGIDKIPTIHLGVKASAMEKRGIETELGNINREINKVNKEWEEIQEELENQADEIHAAAQVKESAAHVPLKMDPQERPSVRNSIENIKKERESLKNQPQNEVVSEEKELVNTNLTEKINEYDKLLEEIDLLKEKISICEPEEFQSLYDEIMEKAKTTDELFNELYELNPELFQDEEELETDYNESYYREELEDDWDMEL